MSIRSNRFQDQEQRKTNSPTRLRRRLKPTRELFDPIPTCDRAFSSAAARRFPDAAPLLLKDLRYAGFAREIFIRLSRLSHVIVGGSLPECVRSLFRCFVRR